MKITLNGTEKIFGDLANLKQLIDEVCKENPHVVAEINGEIIKSARWPEASLHEGDTVELVTFMGGG